MSKLSFVSKLRSMPITPKKKLWMIIPSCILALAIVIMTIFSIIGSGPLNLGIDFTGGTILDVNLVTYLNDDNYDEVKKVVTDTMDKAGLSYSAPQRADDVLTVRFKDEIKGQAATPDQMKEVRDNLTSNVALDSEVGYESLYIQLKVLLGDEVPAPSSLFTYDAVAAVASVEIWLNALYCVLIAAVLILLYVAIRFKLDTGLSALIALAHDILLMIAFVAIFRIQINAPFIAAMITIVGYSINDTIVVFDRIRENTKKVTLSHLTPCEIADTSIRQTFVRSLNTSITTLLTTVLLCVLGVPAIREFTLPIIFGLLAGTYSSIFIAPSFWTVFRQRKINKDLKKGYIGAAPKNSNSAAMVDAE